VLGTGHLLEACRAQPSVRAILVVTTDKCYRNKEQVWGYRENEELGGHDPYSASKAATELLVASFRQSFWSGSAAPLLASARAGNVIGGGDWSEDRLIPDAARAVAAGGSLEIRSPAATRPWQHVLESLSGYLLLGQQLLAGRREFADAFNFGPGADGNRTVASVLTALQAHWPALRWHQTAAPQPHETTLLQLDSTKARRMLGWEPVWSIDEGLRATATWYRQYAEGKVGSARQLDEFVTRATELGRVWAR
jgi:CDP-glucose 4,6-dehydratase